MPARADAPLRLPRHFRGDDAVSPVIGTILILGITVVGIVSVMVWGAPLIQDLQDRNAQTGIVAEFLEVRDAARKLTGAQEARSIGFNLPGGEVHLRAGSQFMVTVNHDPDPAYATCDLQVSEWDDGNDQVTFAQAAGTTCGMPTDGCASGPCVEAFSVSGTSLSVNTLESYSGGVADFTDPIDTTQSWVFRLTDAAGLPVVEAWLFASDELAWDRQSARSDRDVVYLWGMVLSSTDSAVFAEAQPHITEDARRDGDVFLRVPVLVADDASISGTGTHAVFLALDAIAEDMDVTDANLLRYSFSGDKGEAFCNTFVLRNGVLTDDPYSDCSEVEDGIHSTLYTPPSPPINVEVTHAEILARLVL